MSGDELGRLSSLVLKPTLACNAACGHCGLRRTIFSSLKRERALSPDDWRAVLRDGRSLGVTRLGLSGGEPTLYKRLPELIAEAAALGYYVFLNTNGSLINRRYAETLVEAGLNHTQISIYSHRPEIHDAIRGFPGLWKKASEAVRIFSELEKRQPRFRVFTQSVILRENIRSLDELISFHHGIGSSALLFSYLEGDFERKLLVTEDDIRYFRNEVLPRILQFWKSLDRRVRKQAIGATSRLYHPEFGSWENIARGVYQQKRSCRGSQTVILANGSVRPCAIAEYTHDPVMGNVLETPLPELWDSKKWTDFRANLHEYCKLCPMPYQVSVPLRESDSKKTIIQRINDRLQLASLVDVPLKLKVLGQRRRVKVTDRKPMGRGSG